MGDAEGSLEVGRWGPLGLLLCPPRGGSRKAAGGPRSLQPVPSALQQGAAPWLKVGMGLPPKVKWGDGGAPEKGCTRSRERAFPFSRAVRTRLHGSPSGCEDRGR